MKATYKMSDIARHRKSIKASWIVEAHKGNDLTAHLLWQADDIIRFLLAELRKAKVDLAVEHGY